MPLDLIGVNYRKDIDHWCRHYGDVIARSGSLMASALGARRRIFQSKQRVGGTATREAWRERGSHGSQVGLPFVQSREPVIWRYSQL